MLFVEDIAFAYSSAEQPIFKNVSFSLDAGDSLCILGPNGIGKTTLLKCITGLESPHEGAVRLGDNDITRMNRQDIARMIAYVPQFHQPIFAYTIFDIVLMGRSPHIGMTGSPSRSDKAITWESLTTMGIEHLADKAYSEVSGGERQMVLFARVIAQQPKVLLLDEPTAHLDFGNQIQVLSLIKQMAESGLTVIMTSHVPDHAFMAAKTVILMAENDIRIGSPDMVLTQENLQAVYKVDVRIMDNGSGGKTCLPLMA